MRGILAVIAASILFGITPSANKFILLSGMSGDCVLIYQILVMIVSSALVMAVKKYSFRLPVKMILKLLTLGALGIGGTDYLLNLSYGYLQVGTVVMLHFMYPAMVLIIMVAGFHQKLSPLTACTVALSLLGLVLVSDASGGINLTGAALALGSGAFYAFFTVYNEKGGVEHLPLFTRLFYMSLGTFIVFYPKTLICGNFSVPTDPLIGLMLLGGVGVGSFLGFYLITVGIRQIGAERVAFLNMLEPVTGVLAGMLIYREVLTVRSACGCGCVLASVLLIALDGRNKPPVEHAA